MVPKKPWAPKRKIVNAQGFLLRQPFKELMGKPHVCATTPRIQKCMRSLKNVMFARKLAMLKGNYKLVNPPATPFKTKMGVPIKKLHFP